MIRGLHRGVGLLFERDSACDFSCSVKEGGIFFFEGQESLFHEKDFVVVWIGDDFQDFGRVFPVCNDFF